MVSADIPERTACAAVRPQGRPAAGTPQARGAARVEAAFERMRADALSEFAGYGCQPDQVQWECYLEMRYRGQGFELLAQIDPERMKAEGPGYLADQFRESHRARYGTVPASGDIEVVTYRLVAQVPGSREVLDQLGRAPADGAEPEVEESHIVYRGERLPCRFAWRGSLPMGYSLSGLGIVEEPTATTLVPPGWRATVGAVGALILEEEA